MTERFLGEHKIALERKGFVLTLPKRDLYDAGLKTVRGIISCPFIPVLEQVEKGIFVRSTNLECSSAQSELDNVANHIEVVSSACYREKEIVGLSEFRCTNRRHCYNSRLDWTVLLTITMIWAVEKGSSLVFMNNLKLHVDLFATLRCCLEMSHFWSSSYFVWGIAMPSKLILLQKYRCRT